MRFAIVLGTRPEIIKLAPIIRACTSFDIDVTLIHTGQHYSPNMDAVFFSDLELAQPDHNLEIGQLEFRKRVGHCMTELTSIFRDDWPDAVIVQGDTFSVLMGALAARKLDRPVAHVEAGLRSHDLSMPEENYRIIVDHLAEYLYPPTPLALRYIEEEGMEGKQVQVYGNTVADALKQHLEISKKKSRILEELALTPNQYFLVTAHRQENVDIEQRLKGILGGLSLVAEQHSEQLVFALHPRTRKRMKEFGLSMPEGILTIEPPGYLDFIALERNARLILTDSGGIQEEASMLHVPCVTMRSTTERQETIDAGCNVLVGWDEKKIAQAATEMLEKDIEWKDLYGAGDTGKQIVADLKQKVLQRKSIKERLRWFARMAYRAIRGGFR